ncbi:hypothetical protein N7486_010189 [Penicillium sp. IBT 16267x]|nr:hypothetical protein N7486_010189 [Penicillium sp. IBT 16267x]
MGKWGPSIPPNVHGFGPRLGLHAKFQIPESSRLIRPSTDTKGAASRQIRPRANFTLSTERPKLTGYKTRPARGPPDCKCPGAEVPLSFVLKGKHLIGDHWDGTEIINEMPQGDAQKGKLIDFS